MERLRAFEPPAHGQARRQGREQAHAKHRQGGGQADEAKLAFDRGHMQGVERRAYLDSLKESEE